MPDLGTPGAGSPRLPLRPSRPAGRGCNRAKTPLVVPPYEPTAPDRRPRRALRGARVRRGHRMAAVVRRGLREQARREHRFVILDLEAVWCHWCHVMDATT